MTIEAMKSKSAMSGRRLASAADEGIPKLELRNMSCDFVHYPLRVQPCGSAIIQVICDRYGIRRTKFLIVAPASSVPAITGSSSASQASRLMKAHPFAPFSGTILRGRCGIAAKAR
jgi:hypothetical protein